MTDYDNQAGPFADLGFPPIPSYWMPMYQLYLQSLRATTRFWREWIHVVNGPVHHNQHQGRVETLRETHTPSHIPPSWAYQQPDLDPQMEVVAWNVRVYTLSEYVTAKVILGTHQRPSHPILLSFQPVDADGATAEVNWRFIHEPHVTTLLLSVQAPPGRYAGKLIDGTTHTTHGRVELSVED